MPLKLLDFSLELVLQLLLLRLILAVDDLVVNILKLFSAFGDLLEGLLHLLLKLACRHGCCAEALIVRDGDWEGT